MLKQGVEWLLRAPVDDLLDRRHAPGFQLLLVAALTLSAFATWTAWQESRGWDTSVAVAAFCHMGLWGCLWLVRQGRFSLAVGIVFAGLLGLIVLSYQTYGLRAHTSLQVAHLLPLLLGGLLLGRKVLWGGLVVLLLALWLGALVDIQQTGSDAVLRGEIWSEMWLSSLAFVLAAVMLDRFISASRSALRRSEELSRAYQQLAQEVKEKEQAQSRLLQVQKLDILGQLAGGIAHDFNNVLAVILGQAGLLRETSSHSAAAGIENAVRRGMMITRRLLGLGRQRPRHLETCEINQIVRRAMTLIEPLFPAAVQLELSLAEEPVGVRLDADELELALLNMATNARDALGEQGHFQIHVQRAGKQVEVILQDDGCGMPEEVQEKLFDPFFTTKPEDRGSGLGMPVVKRMVEAAQGAIRLDSAPGKGTRITLSFPSVELPEDQIFTRLEGMRVLLLEDEPQLRVLLTQALTQAGCRVAASGHGVHALDMAEDMGELHVVVSDYRLPDANGAEILTAIHDHRPDTLRILISSHPPEGWQESPENGLFFLAKPFTPQQLLSLMGRQWTRARLPHPVDAGRE